MQIVGGARSKQNVLGVQEERKLRSPALNFVKHTHENVAAIAKVN